MGRHIRKVHQVYLQGEEDGAEGSYPPSARLLQEYDVSDGSKGLGHMVRDWDGTFGSFPLHDDYGDESWAD